MRRDLQAVIVILIGAALAVPAACAQAPQANSSAGKGIESVTRGRIKEFAPGQSITIDIPRAFDRTYNLERPAHGQRITVAQGLSTGDRVAILESERGGVNYIRIVPDGVEAAMADGSFTPKVAANGKVIRMTPGRAISIALDSGGERTFDLQKSAAGPRVQVAQGISSGDTVQVLEGQENGRKVVWIDKPSAPETGTAAPATDGVHGVHSRRGK